MVFLVSANFYCLKSSLHAGETIGIHEGFRQTALLSDLEPFTAALVTDPDSILQPNGQITYSKGASIMLMLQSFFEAGKAGSFQVGYCSS